MKRILSIILSLALFYASASAQGTTYKLEDLESKPVAALMTLGEEELGKLETAEAAFAAAEAASSAAPDDADLKAAAEAAEEEYNVALDNARTVRDAIKSNDGDASKLSTGILAISGATEDADAGAVLDLAGEWTQKAKDYVVEEGPTIAVNVVLFLVILFVFRILANIAGGLTGKALSSSKLKVSELLKKFFVGVVQKVVFFAGLLIALERIGVNTGPLLAGVGVVGFVVGFALQDTLSNFAAGIMILLYRPFDVGDVITAGGETGKVEDLTLVSTTMFTPDNQKLILPNGSIWGGTIRNITAQDTRRVDFTIGVGYSDDLDKAQKVLLEVASSHELVLKDPAPQVEVVNLGESSVDFVVRPWSKTSDYWTVYFDLTKAFKQRLDAEGLSIPFPQRDLHLITVPEKLSTGG